MHIKPVAVPGPTIWLSNSFHQAFVPPLRILLRAIFARLAPMMACLLLLSFLVILLAPF